MVRLRSGSVTQTSDPALPADAARLGSIEEEVEALDDGSLANGNSSPNKKRQQPSRNGDSDPSRAKANGPATEPNKDRKDTTGRSRTVPSLSVDDEATAVNGSDNGRKSKKRTSKDDSEATVEKKSDDPAAPGRTTAVHRCGFIDFKPEGIEAIAGWRTLLGIGRASGEVEIWQRNNNSLHQLLTIPGARSSGLRCLVWHGERLFGGNLNGSIFEVDFITRSFVTCPVAGGGGIWSMDSNGEFIATACEDGKVRMYSAKPLSSGVDFERSLHGGSANRLLCIKFHGTEPKNFLFASGMDGIIRKWSIQQKRVVEQIPVPALARSLTIWSLDTNGEMLACGDSLGRVHLWKKSGEGASYSFTEHRADVLAVKFSADGTALFASGVDPRVAAFRMVHGNWVYAYSHRAHTHDVRALGVFDSSKDEVLCSGGIDAQVVWYPTKSFDRVRPRKESIFAHRNAISLCSPAYVNGNERLLLVMHTFNLEVWHIRLQSKQHSHVATINFDDDTVVRCSALSRAGRYIACADDVHGLSVFRLDAADAQEDENEEIPVITISKMHLESIGSAPKALCFGGSENVLIAATDSHIYVIDIEARVITKTFECSNGSIVAVSGSPDGQWLVACSAAPAITGSGLGAAGNIELYNLDALRHHASLPASIFGDSMHAAFEFTPDSNRVIFARTNGSVFMYEVETKALLSRQLNIPSDISEKPIGIVFNSAESDSIVIYCWNCLAVLDAKQHKQASPPRVLRKFKPILYSNFVGPDSLLIVEAPFMNTLKHLPDVIERERYGT